MADKVSKFILPVKSDNTIVNKEFDLPSGGTVSGPSSAVDNRVATFNGATGKLIKDSGYIVGKQLTNEILDDVITPGVYYANSGNYVSNKPSVAVDAFGLTVSKIGNHLSQTVISTSNSDLNAIYRRYKKSGSSWSSWTQYFDERYYTEAEENQIIDGLQTGTSNVQAQVSNSSDDTYSSSKAYAVGDLCIYNNVLYRCITACSAGSWATNQSCFTADTLTNVANIFNYSNSTSINSYWTTSTGTWDVLRKGKTVQINIDLMFLETITMGSWFDLRILPNWAKPAFDFSITVILPDGQKGLIAFRKDDNYIRWYGYDTVTNQSYHFYHCITYLVNNSV